MDGQASDVYLIRGLPAILTAPVQVTLPTNTPVDPVQALVATRQLWGAGDYARPQAAGDGPVSAASAHALLPMEAAEVSAVTIALSAGIEPPPDQTDSEIETFVLRNFHKGSCPGGYFDLFYPNVQPFAGHFDQICRWLNEAKQNLESLGLVFGTGRKRWPFRAVYVTFGGGSERWGEHVPGASGNINYDSIRLNDELVWKAIQRGQPWEDELHVTIGDALFHFVQNAYDSRSKGSVATVPHRDLWFEEALSTWFEGVTLGQSNYFSYSTRSFCLVFRLLPWPGIHGAFRLYLGLSAARQRLRLGCGSLRGRAECGLWSLAAAAQYCRRQGRQSPGGCDATGAHGGRSNRRAGIEFGFRRLGPILDETGAKPGGKQIQQSRGLAAGPRVLQRRGQTHRARI